MKLMKLMTAAFVAAAFAITPNAWADTDTSNDNVGLTITINPDFDAGVTISSANVTLTKTVGTGATVYFTDASTVTVAGDLVGQEWDIQGFNLDTWTLDTDDNPAQDVAQLYGLFATARTSAPTAAQFEAGDPTQNLIHGGGETRAGGTPGNGTVYEQTGGASLVDMDGMGLGAARQLWLRMDGPNSTTVSGAQDFQIRITAQPAS